MNGVEVLICIFIAVGMLTLAALLVKYNDEHKECRYDDYDISYLDEIIKELDSNKIEMTEETGLYLEKIVNQYKKEDNNE